MTGALLLFAAWWAPVIVLALALQLSGKFSIQWRWITAASGVYAVYALAWHWGLPDNVGALPAESRWLSRITSLVVGVGALALIWKRAEALEPAAMGLTLKQRPGSLKWSILGLVALALLGTVPGGFTPGVEQPSLSAIAYHATLPGIEEEIIYRAVLWGLFTAALGEGRTAPIWAAVMSWIVFTLAHAVTLSEGGQVQFSVFIFGYVGLAGVVLTWMRLKSGSIVMPVIAHNLIGLAGRLA